MYLLSLYRGLADRYVAPRLAVAVVLGFVTYVSCAQSATFVINTDAQRKNISPLIYGYNAYANDSGLPNRRISAPGTRNASATPSNAIPFASC